MNTKKFSIIIVTHNSAHEIRPCIDALLAQANESFEIIVVDNGSQDGTSSLIKNSYPGVRVIENKENKGPSVARNMGVEQGRGEWIMFLDSDTVVKDNFLAWIMQESKGERVAVLQPLILKMDNRTVYSAGVYLSFLRRFYDIGNGRVLSKRFSKLGETFGACLAAAVYRRKALEDIRQGREYFDEDFFYLVEDVDMAWRLRNKRWKAVFIPGAICLHKGGRSRNKDRTTQYLCMRNRYLMIIKNESLAGFLRYFFVFFMYDFWRNLYMFCTNTRLFLKALQETIALAPKMIKKRLSSSLVRC